MRKPKKAGKKAGPPKAGPAAGAAGSAAAAAMDHDGPPAVWRPGLDPVASDEELDYDPTAYDCLHKFSLEWPCLSFDIVPDQLGGPRSTFPHEMYMVAGTQAAQPRQNYLAVLRLAALGQGRHGKKPDKAAAGSDGESSEDDDSDDSMSDASDDPEDKEPPARMHHRLVQQTCGINRVRVCPQQPHLTAFWGDNAQVRVVDVGQQLAALAGEEEVVGHKAATKVQVNPLQAHHHADEGFALDWSRVRPARLASGDCKKHIHVWEPQEGGRWQVSSVYNGHTGSVEDLQWSPTEESVFASCGVDHTIRVWDTRERSRSMLAVTGHDADVNVISWNRLVTYMLASGGDDGALRIWDLRSFKEGGHVSHFAFHRGPVTSVEWSPYESSMLITSGGDHQVAVWDLALERDPEEEAALAPPDNAALQEDLPAQLLFVHAGQTDIKEGHWHGQIPGLIATTAVDGFNVFRPSNL